MGSHCRLQNHIRSRHPRYPRTREAVVSTDIDLPEHELPHTTTGHKEHSGSRPLSRTQALDRWISTAVGRRPRGNPDCRMFLLLSSPFFFFWGKPLFGDPIGVSGKKRRQSDGVREETGMPDPRGPGARHPWSSIVNPQRTQPQPRYTTSSVQFSHATFTFTSQLLLPHQFKPDFLIDAPSLFFDMYVSPAAPWANEHVPLATSNIPIAVKERKDPPPISPHQPRHPSKPGQARPGQAQSRAGKSFPRMCHNLADQPPPQSKSKSNPSPKDKKGE